MLPGPLHDKGPDGRGTACGEPWVCPDGLAIYEAVVAQFDDLAVLQTYGRELESDNADQARPPEN